MSQKNETLPLLISLLVTLGLIGGVAWWLLHGFNPAGLTGTQAGDQTSSPTGGSSQMPFDQRWSVGTRILSRQVSEQKQAGVQAMAAKNYTEAAAAFQSSLQADRNDPEALIYLNNAQIGNRKAYTIAVSVPLMTADNSASEILRGAAQAQTEVNQAGGIGNVPLKIMIVSDDNVPDICQQVAAGLVKDQSVLGVVGHFGSEATLAAAPVYEQGKLVLISPTSTSVQISNAGSYIFRTVPSDRFTATALSRHLLNGLHKQNAAVYFNSSSSYSQSLKDEFTTALTSEGGQVVSEFDLSTNFDAAASLQQAKQQKAEALVLLANTSTLDAALQVVAVNRHVLPLLGGDSIYNPKTLQIGGENAADMVVAVPWILLSNPQSKFVQTARSLWGGDVNWRSATAYDAVLTLATALKQNPSREGVQQSLANSSFSVDGATGTVRFLPSGDRNQAMQLVVVRSGKRSGYGFDFVPLQGSL